MNDYNKEKFKNLIHKFPNSERIEKNYSQACQDFFVLTMLNGKKGGNFLEIGGSNAKILSNTYLLETEFGWSGISVDLDPQHEESFKERKNTNFILHDALTLDYEKILEENSFESNIDYLQIDIEPQIQSLRCLKLIPFHKYTFSVITFETDLYDTRVSREESYRNREESRTYLSSLGYELVVGNVCNLSENDPFEDWYVNPKIVNMDIINSFKTTSEFNKPARELFFR